LQIGDKEVPNNPKDFLKILEGVKGDPDVRVLILRKGKQHTVRGLILVQPKTQEQGKQKQFHYQWVPLDPKERELAKEKDLAKWRYEYVVPKDNIKKAPGGPLPKGGGDNTIMTTTLRTGDRFTTRYQEGSLIITLTGTVAGGKAKAGEIVVQD